RAYRPLSGEAVALVHVRAVLLVAEPWRVGVHEGPVALGLGCAAGRQRGADCGGECFHFHGVLLGCLSGLPVGLGSPTSRTLRPSTIAIIPSRSCSAQINSGVVHMDGWA